MGSGALALNARDELRGRFLRAADKSDLHHFIICDDTPRALGLRCIPADKLDAIERQLDARSLALPIRTTLGLSSEEIEYSHNVTRVFGDWEFFHFDDRSAIGRFMLLGTECDIGEARRRLRELVADAVKLVPGGEADLEASGAHAVWMAALYRRGGLTPEALAGETLEWLPQNVFTLSAAVLASVTDADDGHGDDQAIVRLLSVFSNGISDDRIRRAAIVLENENLTANEKLTKIDGILSLPATTSGEQLGRMLGVSKQAVQNTDWWRLNRKGEKANEVGRRRKVHQQRAKQSEPNRPIDDDE